MIINPAFTHFYCSTWRLGKQQLMAQEGLNVWTPPSGCLRNQPGLFVPICSVALRSKSLEPMLICSVHISICVCSNTVGHLFSSFTSILFTYSLPFHTRPRAVWTLCFNASQQFWTFGLVIILRGLHLTHRQLASPRSSSSLPVPWRLGLNTIPAAPPPQLHWKVGGLFTRAPASLCFSSLLMRRRRTAYWGLTPPPSFSPCLSLLSESVWKGQTAPP